MHRFIHDMRGTICNNVYLNVYLGAIERMNEHNQMDGYRITFIVLTLIII